MNQPHPFWHLRPDAARPKPLSPIGDKLSAWIRHHGLDPETITVDELGELGRRVLPMSPEQAEKTDWHEAATMLVARAMLEGDPDWQQGWQRYLLPDRTRPDDAALRDAAEHLAHLEDEYGPGVWAQMSLLLGRLRGRGVPQRPAMWIIWDQITAGRYRPNLGKPDGALVADENGDGHDLPPIYVPVMWAMAFVRIPRRAPIVRPAEPGNGKTNGEDRDLSPAAGGDTSSPPNRKRQKLRWLADAMLLVREHPDWSDAEIARHVDKDKATLCRSAEYKAAAVRAREPRRVLNGHKSTDGAVEAYNGPTGRSHRGEPIRGSDLYREYCADCGEAIRVPKTEVGTQPRCAECQ